METLKNTISLVKAHAKANFVPIVRDKTLEILSQTCREIGAKEVLEIGTATGYSALNLILCGAMAVTTIEKNEERFSQAKSNFQTANVSDKVTQILGDAREIIEKLAHSDKKFDLIFLDGPKGQYVRYLPFLKRLLKTDGVLFADNILLNGLIKDESRVNHKNRTMVNNMKKFLKEIQSDPDLETQIFEIEDGFAISKKLS